MPMQRGEIKEYSTANCNMHSSESCLLLYFYSNKQYILAALETNTVDRRVIDARQQWVVSSLFKRYKSITNSL